MRTADFSTILFEAIQFSGNDRHTISDETFAQFRDFANGRLRQVWEMHDWPDLVYLAQFTALKDANDVPYFVPASNAGEILGVWNKNPQVTTKITPMGYEPRPDGTIAISDELAANGWYRYRLKPPVLSGDVWSKDVAYSIGAQVYFDAGAEVGSAVPTVGKPCRGNFYNCIAATTANLNTDKPVNNGALTAKWEKVDVPYIFAPYMAWGAAADWNFSEGDVEAGTIVEAKANAVLELELDKVLRQQGQIDRINMTKTY